jgi:hypothetical protein
MDVKLKSKTHLLNTFLFLCRFLRYQEGIKNAEFHADFKSAEKVCKNAPEKVFNKTSLTNMNKSIKKCIHPSLFC